MQPRLSDDLKALEGLPLKPFKGLPELVTRIHQCLSRRMDPVTEQQLVRLKSWLLCPISLWPIDLSGLTALILDCVEKSKSPPKRLALVQASLSDPPDEKTIKAIYKYEALVASGSYEVLAERGEKYQEREQQILDDPAFSRDWECIKSTFKAWRYANSNGVTRRSFVQERNFRPDFSLLKPSGRQLFQAAFDAFCHRWNLYGVENDRPLVMKLSATVTPHGTMLFVPAYWSFDYRRDLKWQTITNLHRCRGVARQGPKLSPSRVERGRQEVKAMEAWERAGAQGFHGDARYAEVKRVVRLPPRTSERTIRAMVSKGRKISGRERG